MKTLLEGGLEDLVRSVGGGVALVRLPAGEVLDCPCSDGVVATPLARIHITGTARLHPFACSWLYNATAVRGALW